MNEKPVEWRRRLFDTYSRNLSIYFTDATGVFVCPLCRRAFARDAVEGDNPALSLAHVISAKLGSDFCTLTCTPCNNRGGSDLEAALVAQFAEEDWAAGIQPKKNVRLAGDFGSGGAEVHLSSTQQPGVSLRIIDKQSNPANIESLKQYLQRMQGGGAANVQFNLRWLARNRPRRVRTALLQSAYLLLFAYFGYEFALHPAYEKLREQILNPDQSLWEPHVAILSDSDANRMVDKRLCAIVFIREPRYILAPLRFRPRDGRERVLGVMLPGPEGPAPPEPPSSTFRSSIVSLSPQDFLGEKHSFQNLWLAWSYQHQQVEDV